ncbi:MAG: RidA family protein [Oscillospiraceae bacterium]|nr:RidA family protein [Oscillospiraceae bacterium]
MEKIYTENAPKAIGPYSQAVKANGFLFTSGQIAIDPATGTVTAQGIEEQTHQICRNLSAVLAASGLTFADVVKTTCFLTNMSYFPQFNEIYAQYFTGKPARSCVEVSKLPAGVLAEIELVAKL